MSTIRRAGAGAIEPLFKLTFDSRLATTFTAHS